MRYFLAVAAAALMSAAAQAQTAPATASSTSAPADDPYIWLEEVEGEKPLAWVRERNDRSLGVLQADPRYARFHADALRIVEAKDRIPQPSFVRERIGNFWQD